MIICARIAIISYFFNNISAVVSPKKIADISFFKVKIKHIMPEILINVFINPIKNKDGDSKKRSAFEIEIIKIPF